MKGLFFALAPLALSIALAADPAEKSADEPKKPQLKLMKKNEIPLEYLAHNFFFHNADAEVLKSIISEEGINRLKPELAEHRREMTDLHRIAPKVRRMCGDLQKAKTGEEFAAVFIETEERRQIEMRQAARRILSKLDDDDRSALERYLDTEYRQGAGHGTLDYKAMFASGPFPTPESNLLLQRTCDSASEMEVRVEP